ncbi:MAG: histidinol-phosphate transaminase [Methanoregula sp.]
MNDFPKREVHGGTGKRQREKTRKNVLDFSASVNPFPPVVAWPNDPSYLGHYPDNDYHELKETIASTFHRNPEEICVGNGSIELIRLFCSIMLRGDKKFFTESHTFGEYALSARLAGARKAGSSRESDVVFICNPNNPTGTLRNKVDMICHLEEAKSRGTFLFCDEAFIELSDPAQSLADVCDSALFVLHSLTKSFSVPGIRFGYGFGDPDLIEKIEVTRPPWSVNAFAEAYAIQAFRHRDELARSRAMIAIERDFLTAGMGSLGLRSRPSSANFLLVECGRDVASLCSCLAERDILVRDCTSFGLPTCIRVAVRTRNENQVLLEALSACMR